jgi:hypothetical protein
MTVRRAFLRVVFGTILAGGANGAISSLHNGDSGLLLAQVPSDQRGSGEVDQLLFVQSPERDLGGHAIVVIWMPQPLQRLCLGKTATQCSIIDYCIRTTNRGSPQCKNIGINLQRIPPYPPATLPRRMQSVVLSYLSPTKFAPLQDFFRNASRASLESISMDARIKARIRYTATPNDGFELLDVLAVPPF